MKAARSGFHFILFYFCHSVRTLICDCAKLHVCPTLFTEKWNTLNKIICTVYVER